MPPHRMACSPKRSILHSSANEEGSTPPVQPIPASAAEVQLGVGFTGLMDAHQRKFCL